MKIEVGGYYQGDANTVAHVTQLEYGNICYICYDLYNKNGKLMKKGSKTKLIYFISWAKERVKPKREPC